MILSRCAAKQSLNCRDCSRPHHARFDLESGCTFDLWADDVPRFPLELRDGEVWVKTTLGDADPAAHWRQRLADGLAHDLGLVIAGELHQEVGSS
jgi:hypothetical protein